VCVCDQVKWKNLHFIMWVIGGQESLRQAWSTYYTGTHILLLVVDSTDRDRLAVAREELYKMLGHEVCVRACVCCVHVFVCVFFVCVCDCGRHL